MLIEVTATTTRKGFHDGWEPAVITSLLNDVRRDFLSFAVISLDEPLLLDATRLVQLHRLRTMDAIHLAAALSLRMNDEIVMVSSDQELLSASVAESLAVLDPVSMTL